MRVKVPASKVSLSLFPSLPSLCYTTLHQVCVCLYATAGFFLPSSFTAHCHKWAVTRNERAREREGEVIYLEPNLPLPPLLLLRTYGCTPPWKRSNSSLIYSSLGLSWSNKTNAETLKTFPYFYLFFLIFFVEQPTLERKVNHFDEKSAVCAQSCCRINSYLFISFYCKEGRDDRGANALPVLATADVEPLPDSLHFHTFVIIITFFFLSFSIHDWFYLWEQVRERKRYKNQHSTGPLVCPSTGAPS